MQDLKYLNALNTIPGVGPATLRTLKNHFGTFERAWVASESSLRASGIADRVIELLQWKRPSIHPDREMEKLIREEIWTVTEENDLFPSLLREIPHPPVILYGRGDLKNFPRPHHPQITIGVVGTRKPTPYGREAVGSIVHALASRGVSIISGLAFGIDAAAHEATLDVGGFTVAVLGSGIDKNSIYPIENRGLLHRIIQNGGVVFSEYAPGTPAVKEHFPQRNRIISGVSRGVLVIEAKEKSGALITARFALEQNRDVFAVPGQIFSPTAAGPHVLIQQGAKLIRSAEDILEEYGIEYTGKQTSGTDPKLHERHNKILHALERPLGIDEIKAATGMDASLIVATISFLELRGLIRSLGPDMYQRTS